MTCYELLLWRQQGIWVFFPGVFGSGCFVTLARFQISGLHSQLQHGYMITYWVVTQAKRGSAGKPPSPCLVHSKLPSLLQHMLPLSCFITASISSHCNWVCHLSSALDRLRAPLSVFHLCVPQTQEKGPCLGKRTVSFILEMSWRCLWGPGGEDLCQLDPAGSGSCQRSLDWGKFGEWVVSVAVDDMFGWGVPS